MRVRGINVVENDCVQIKALGLTVVGGTGASSCRAEKENEAKRVWINTFGLGNSVLSFGDAYGQDVIQNGKIYHYVV
jgi:hypothetical protein